MPIVQFVAQHTQSGVLQTALLKRMTTLSDTQREQRQGGRAGQKGGEQGQAWPHTHFTLWEWFSARLLVISFSQHWL